MLLDLRKILGDADMTLDKALERALHIEAVARIEEEEDNEPRVSAIQSNDDTQLVYSINNLVLTQQTNQSNRHEFSNVFIARSEAKRVSARK